MEQEQADRNARYGIWAAVIFGWWTVNGLASASQYYVLRGSTEMPITWAYALGVALTSAYMSVPVTVLALWLGWRHPFERHRWPASFAIHLLAALAVVLFRAVLVVQLNPWVGWYGEIPPFHHVLLTSFTNNFFLYWMLVGVAHAVHYARASRLREQFAEQLKTELVRTQLHALRAQLHPHFLFNALNTVVSLVHTDPDRAERTLTRLGDLLRRSLKQSTAEEIPLQEELEFVRAYVEVEQARFEERLQVEWRIAPDTLPACVPPLLLQPLVENAIRHGIAPRSAPGRVEIRSERRNGSLRLLVQDDGVGLGATGAGGGGVGLTSTRKRLDRMYGGRHDFRLEAAAGGGAVAEVTIPFRTADASEPPIVARSASNENPR